MRIQLMKVSEDGRSREYSLEVVDAWWDPLYNLGGREVIGAIRMILISGSEFHLTGIHDPYRVVTLIKNTSEDLIITPDYWDFDKIPDEEAFNLCKVKGIDFSCFIKAAEKVRYFAEFMQAIELNEWGNIKKTKRFTDAQMHLLRRSLPTPGKPTNVSKIQYLKYFKT